MEVVKLVLWIAALSAAFTSISFAQKTMGPFYCVQEGFFPRSLETEYFAYDTIVQGTKKDPEDKRINGNFTVKKPMKKLAIIAEMHKESNKNWHKFGPTYNIYNACTQKISLDYFESCFSGTLNKDDCSMDAGRYTLDNYNIENDMKAHSNKMFYGHWRFIIIMKAEVEGKVVELVTFTYQMHINDEEQRVKQQIGSAKSNRQKGKKN